MNLYLSEEQVKSLSALLEESDDNIKLLQDLNPSSKFEENIGAIQLKLMNKKMVKVAPKKKEPIEIPCLRSDDSLIITPRKDGKAMILESKNKLADKDRFTFHLNLEKTNKLILALSSYLDDWGIDYDASETVAYSDEVHVYANEVERSINVSSHSLDFICYTDKEDDYWTFLTPHKAKRLIELLYGYQYQYKAKTVNNNN